MNRVVPGEESEPEKSKNEKAGEDEDAINKALFCSEMHENRSDQSRFEGCDEQRDGDVGFSAASFRKVDMKYIWEPVSEIDV